MNQNKTAEPDQFESQIPGHSGNASYDDTFMTGVAIAHR